MYLQYDEGQGACIVFYDETDKCKFCKYQDKCPLILALQLSEYCIPIRDKIPTQEFCEMYEPNNAYRKMVRDLEKKNKYKER